MSIVLDGQWSEPASNSIEDIEAAERKLQFEIGLYAHPIFKGNWPDIVIKRMEDRNKKQSHLQSRLPVFSQQEIDKIKGTFDFMGFNTYTTNYVANAAEAAYDITSYENDLRVILSDDRTWKKGNNNNPIVPWGIRKVLSWLKHNYDDPEIFILENGVADNGSIEDDIRISYYKDYLTEVNNAMNTDEVKVIGYTAWSLLDNFEWIFGYRDHFGLYQVDFNSPNRTRTPKKSAAFFKKIATTHQLPGYSSTQESLMFNHHLLIIIIITYYYFSM